MNDILITTKIDDVIYAVFNNGCRAPTAICYEGLDYDDDRMQARREAENEAAERQQTEIRRIFVCDSEHYADLESVDEQVKVKHKRPSF
jgi:hypothetical protein